MSLPLPRVALVVALLAALVAGCGGAPAVPAPPAAIDPTAPRAVPAGMGSPAADGVFPRTVGHFGGSTEIAARPQRVVVISTGQLDAALALGVVPVGSTRGDKAGLVPAYLSAAFPQQAAGLAAMADVGLRTSPNLEAVAAAKPDLILANEAGGAELYPKLSQIAPTVITEGTGVNWKQDLLLVAHALGTAGAAQRLLDTFHADAAALGARLGARRPAVSFLRITADRVRVFGVGSFPGSVAEDAGLARPPAQQFAQTSEDLSPEQLGRADGDRIFYGVQGGAASAAALLNGPVWKGIPAVTAGRITEVDDDVWYLNAGPVAARTVLDGLSAALGGSAG